MQTLLISLFSLFLTFSIRAQTIANIEIPDTVSHSEQSTKLLLNGAGIRTKFIFDIYIGSLYLEKKTHSAEEIYNLAGEKRINLARGTDDYALEKSID